MAPAVDVPLQSHSRSHLHARLSCLCRPYVRLTDYDVVEPALSGAVIAKKLASRKAGGCSGEHCSTREELGCFRWGPNP